MNKLTRKQKRELIQTIEWRLKKENFDGQCKLCQRYSCDSCPASEDYNKRLDVCTDYIYGHYKLMKDIRMMSHDEYIRIKGEMRKDYLTKVLPIIKRWRV